MKRRARKPIVQVLLQLWGEGYFGVFTRRGYVFLHCGTNPRSRVSPRLGIPRQSRGVSLGETDLHNEFTASERLHCGPDSSLSPRWQNGRTASRQRRGQSVVTSVRSGFALPAHSGWGGDVLRQHFLETLRSRIARRVTVGAACVSHGGRQKRVSDLRLRNGG